MHASQSGNQRLTSGLLNGDVGGAKEEGQCGESRLRRQSALLNLWFCRRIQGVNKGKETQGAVPRVTLLYTLLDLTGGDATLGWRATVESELECKK